VHEDKSLASIVDTSLRKPMRTELLLCDRWQTSAQACTCC